MTEAAPKKYGVPGMIQKMEAEEAAAKQAVVLSPPALIQQAIAAGAGVEVIERLMTLQERWEQHEAKKAFNAAIAAFKADTPEILKTIEVGYDAKSGGGRTSYKHEDLAKVFAVVDEALAKHGLWVRYKTDTAQNLVTVTCIIGHKDGHTEEDNKLSAAPDTTGSKNAVQAIGSVVTYLQRYTLKAALGVAAARDDDGLRSGAAVLTEEQAAEIHKTLRENPKIDIKKFLELAGASTVNEIMGVKFASAKQYLKRQVEKINKAGAK